MAAGIMQTVKDIATKTDGYNIKVSGIISRITVKWHMMKHCHIVLMIKENL